MMNKIITLLIAGLAAVMVLLLITRWATSKKRKGEQDEVIQLPTFVWMTSILAAGGIIMYRVLVAAGQAVDIWIKLKPSDVLKDMATTCCFMIGIGACWLLLLIGITAALVPAVLTGNNRREAKVEVFEAGYFVVQGGLLLGTSLLMIPVLDELLALCLPVYKLNYFH
ncbi:hypothetical protein [Filimonas effusa]|uniref:Uncharacterized protein n=1 Tax=Filimonas effusa TaxID=2508721 RepID=A0A4Q1D5I7_9BACT|nr:hypothetical protein [Filimonas effusa]RXK83648.1 hypothetical protein ESB13_16330 [Filimonas effusa]